MNFRRIFRFELFVDPHDFFSGREFIDISASIFVFRVFLIKLSAAPGALAEMAPTSRPALRAALTAALLGAVVVRVIFEREHGTHVALLLQFRAF